MKWSWAVIAAYTALALVVVPIFPHFVSPNEFARWLLDASIIEHGTIEVTRLAPLLGPRFEDVAVVNGRMYSNKAPGTNLLSLPGYAAARVFTTSLRPLITAERIAASTLPLMFLAVLFIRLATRWNVDDKRSAVVIWVLLFATPLFAYGLLFFSHALVAFTLFGAWYFLYEERHEALAGTLIGIAVSAEYPMAIPAAVIIAPLLMTRRILYVVAGGLPFAIALGIYHVVAFGGPLRNPYAFSKLVAYRELAAGGFLGIRPPSPARLAQLLFDPTYGLLIFAPVLVLSVPVLVLARPRLTLPAWWTLVLVPPSMLVLYAGYPFWHGGWNVGPRYLMPMVPFLVAPMLLGGASRRWRIAVAALGGASTLIVALTTLVFPFVPNAFSFPWMSLAAPLLGRGLVAPNLFHLLARPLAIAIPFAIVAFAAVVANRREVVYALAGALLVLIIGVREQTPAQHLQRAYVEEVYFERQGALRKLGIPLPAGLIARRTLETQLPPSSWPF